MTKSKLLLLMTMPPAPFLANLLTSTFKILTDHNLDVRVVPVVELGELAGVVKITDLFEAFVDAYAKRYCE